MITKEQMDRAEKEFRTLAHITDSEAADAERALEQYTYAPNEPFDPATRQRYADEFAEADYMAESRAWIHYLIVQELKRASTESGE